MWAIRFQAEMSEGVWAAKCSDGRLFGLGGLHEEFAPLSEAEMLALREHAGLHAANTMGADDARKKGGSPR